jgi:hypothetical protein
VNGTSLERIVTYPSEFSRHSLGPSVLQDMNISVEPGRGRLVSTTDGNGRFSRGQQPDNQVGTPLPTTEVPQSAHTIFQRRTVSTDDSSVPSMGAIRTWTVAKDSGRRVEDVEYLDLPDENRHPSKRPRLDPIGPNSVQYRLARDPPAQQSEPRYVSVLSPVNRLTELGRSHVASPSRFARYRAQATKHRDSEISSSFTDVAHAGERHAARPPLERLSGAIQSRSQDMPAPSIPSPRVDGGSRVSSHRHSIPVPSSLDRGVQEYRAFRARERQDRTLGTPHSRLRPQRRGEGDIIYATTPVQRGRPRQAERARSPSTVSHYGPSSAFVQDLVNVDDHSYRSQDEVFSPRSGRPSERIIRSRRRSASPLMQIGSRSRELVADTGVPLDWHREDRSDYVPAGWEHAPQHEDRSAPVLVRPGRR